MTILVVGATGATGQLVVAALLERGEQVRAIVRSKASVPETIMQHQNLTIIQASLLDLSDEELIEHVSACSAVISCLGHTLSLKGMFGAPRRLVTDAVRGLCRAIKASRPGSPVKFVLMNTTGNNNRDLAEQRSTADKCVIKLLRILLPPHADNEDAADYLRTQIGQKDHIIEWVVVRPDALIDETKATELTVHPSPIRSAIFDSGKTSRINVAFFMAELVSDQTLWSRWAGKMPVIYNRGD